jgi:hypothetical protein
MSEFDAFVNFYSARLVIANGNHPRIKDNLLRPHIEDVLWNIEGEGHGN